MRRCRLWLQPRQLADSLQLGQLANSLQPRQRQTKQVARFSTKRQSEAEVWSPEAEAEQLWSPHADTFPKRLWEPEQVEQFHSQLKRLEGNVAEYSTSFANFRKMDEYTQHKLLAAVGAALIGIYFLWDSWLNHNVRTITKAVADEETIETIKDALQKLVNDTETQAVIQKAVVNILVDKSTQEATVQLLVPVLADRWIKEYMGKLTVDGLSAVNESMNALLVDQVRRILEDTITHEAVANSISAILQKMIVPDLG